MCCITKEIAKRRNAMSAVINFCCDFATYMNLLATEVLTESMRLRTSYLLTALKHRKLSIEQDLADLSL